MIVIVHPRELRDQLQQRRRAHAKAQRAGALWIARLSGSASVLRDEGPPLQSL